MRTNTIQNFAMRFATMAIVLLTVGVGSAWGGTDTKTETFESKDAGSNYQSTVTVSTSESSCGIGWEIYYGCVSTSSAITSSNSAAMRLYTTANYGYLKSTTAVKGLTQISFKGKASESNSANIKIDIEYSTNGGSSWSKMKKTSASGSDWTAQALTSSSATYTAYIPTAAISASSNYLIKISINSGSTKPSKSNAQLTIDDVVFTYTTYSVTYDGNGKTSGTVPTDATKYTSGSTVTVKSNSGSLAKTGYTFDGWNTQDDGLGTNYTAGSGTFSISSDITLYAKWTASCTPQTVTVSDGDTGSDAYEGEYDYGTSPISLSLSKTGSGAVTWTSDATDIATVSGNSSGATVTIVGAGIATITASVAADATYCAGEGEYTLLVNAVAPTLSHNTSGKELGTSYLTSTSVRAAGGIVTNKGGADITKYGFVIGSSSSVDYSTADKKQETSGDVTLNTAFAYKDVTGLTPNTTYYVRAFAYNGTEYGYSTAVSFTTLQRYSILYNNNGGSGSMDGDYKDHGVNFTLPANAGSMTKTGHHITGWLLGSSSGTHYDVSGTYEGNAAATFYVEWTANTYQVAFNANGGTGSMSNEDFTYGASAKALTTCSFTPPIHKYFIGWNTDKDATSALYTDGQSVSNLTTTHEGTVTLYAIWEDHTFTNYRTMCCTPLGTINGSVSFTNPTTAVLTWDNIDHVDSWTAKWKTGAGSYATTNVSAITTNGAGKKTCTVTGLSCNTSYDFIIIATPDDGYCDKEEELTNKNSGKWDLDYTFSGAALKDGDLDEGTGVLCGDLDITIEPLSVAYELPSDVTVTIGGNSKTKGTDYTWDSSTGELHIDEADIDGAVAVSCTASLVGCLADPSIGAVSLKTGGTFNLGQVDVTVATSGTGSATCAWTDYGFVWSESANPTVGGSGCTKVAVGSDGSATTWNGSLTKTSFATGTTYYYRAYGKNSKTSAAFAYSSSDGTFKPQSVTFNKANGEDNVVTYVNYNTAVSKPSNPSKTGYDFDEWQLSSLTYDFSDAVTSDITLTATWNAKSYIVTLKPNTGTGSDQTVSATFDADMPLKTTADGTPAISVPTKTGYTLLGYWDATSDGNQYYSYNAGTSTLSSFRTWNKTDATNLYAHWQANNYTITLDNEGADSGKEGTESISVTYDAYTNLNGTPAITKPVKDGYLFGGYFVGDDGTGTQIIDGDGNVIASVASYTSGTKQWIYANNITLHAKWTQVYTVIWSVNGETWSSGVVEGNTHVPGGSQVSALPTAPTSSDCDDAKVFVGWRATAIDGTSASNPGSIFTTQAGSPTISANTTFYAVFADVSGGDVIEFKLPFDNKDKCGVANYTSSWVAEVGDYSWTISNFNNNKFSTGWTTDIRCGRDGNASIASITTDDAISFRVDSVYINLTATNDSYINSAKLQISSSSGISTPDEINIPVNASGVKGLKITSPAKDKYYRVIFDCKSGNANGFVRIGSIVYKQKLDTANYATSCASCDDDATYTNTTPTVSDIDCTTATLTMEDGLATVGADGCHVSDYGFVIGTSDNPAIGGSGVEKLQVGTSDPTVGEDFSFDATGLTKGTHYYIRAYAINKHGTAYSTSTNFWTKNVSSIAITTASTKTNYLVGETFDATGMVVTATMADSNTEDVTSDVTYSSSALTAGANQDFAINYSLCETAKSVNQKINVYTLTVTEGTNPSYGTAAGSVNIVSITGLGSHKTYTVTVTSDNATAVDNGDNTWSIINPTGNVTVTVDYADAVQVKVYYKVDGVTVTGLTQDVYQSETTTLPTASELATAMTAQGMDIPDDDYPNFYGWSETEFPAQTAEPTIVTGTPTINAEKTYYAVYTNLNKITIIPSDFSTSYPSSGSADGTKTFGGKRFGWNYLLNGNVSKTNIPLQFKKNATEYGRLYNTDPLNYILRVEIGYYNADSYVPVYVASGAGTISGDALTPASRESTDPYVYTMPASTSYFYIKGDNSTVYKIRSVDIYYSPATVYYMTQFCTNRVTLTQNSPEHGTVEFGRSSLVTCGSDKNVSLTIIPDVGYQLTGWTVNTSSGYADAKTTSPAVVTNSNNSAAQNITLTFAEDANGAYDVTASFSLMTVTSWAWTMNSAAIPDPLNLYVGQTARFDVAYTPAGVDNSKKTYTRNKVDAYINWSGGKQATYSTIEGRASTGDNTTAVTFTHADGPETVVNVKVKPLPLVHFKDNVHGVEFDDVVATLTANALTNGGVDNTPTHDDFDGSTANTCEEQHLHLVGWIDGAWPAYAAYMAGTGDKPSESAIVGATGYFYLPGAEIDLVAKDGHTYYAIWAKVE